MRAHSRFTSKVRVSVLPLIALAALTACKKDAPPADAPDASPTASASPSAAPSTSPSQTAIESVGPDAGAALAWALPNKLGRFLGGPVETGSYYIRRSYADTRAQMEVTISDSRSPSLPLSPKGEPSQFFLRESSAYPQISLDIPKGTGTGFYDCVELPAGQRCSGYIMLFDGFHVEVLNGDATRADIDAMIAALPLKKLATLR